MASKQPRKSSGAKRARAAAPHPPDDGSHSQPVPEGDRLLPPKGGEGGLPTDKSKLAKPPAPMSRKEKKQAKTARQNYLDWTESDAGKERLKTAGELLGNGWEKLPRGMIHMLKGWDQQSGKGPRHYDVQLPGLQDPNAAPRPPKWEELSHATQQHSSRELMLRAGMTIDDMRAQYGAQLDQAYVRAERLNGPGARPFSEDFYVSGEPRQVVEKSAKDLGIPTTVHSHMNALTSPNTVFSHTYKSGPRKGETVYPNNEAAVHAVEHSLQGNRWNTLSNVRTDGSGKKHQGYVTNMQKASKAMEQHLSGVAAANWRGLPSKTNPEGSHVWGPKTGPYSNSWSDSHPQFFVSDVHSGGGGMVAHLGSEKTGKATKSPRELVIEKVPFFHSMADYSARKEAIARGHGFIREDQAAQWGEEKLRREPNLESDAYPMANRVGNLSSQFKASPSSSSVTAHTVAQASNLGIQVPEGTSDDDFRRNFKPGDRTVTFTPQQLF